MKTFLIAGDIVDESYGYEDVTPTKVKSFLDSLEDGEDVEFQITSFGGSVTAGLAISNLIKQASEKGHNTVSRVIGVAASTASFVALSCKEVKIDSTAFLMIHNPYTWLEGDATELRKEADTLDQFKASIIEIYGRKMNAVQDQISEMMNKETWLRGDEIKDLIECEVIPVEKDPVLNLKKNKYLNHFSHLPEQFKDSITDKSEEPKQEETVTKAECEKRVSGMQSAMAKQMETLKKSYTDKITDLQNQLQDCMGKLTSSESNVISLQDSLKKAENELLETASALKLKNEALETLNSGVNERTEELPTLKEGLAKCKTPKEKVDFITSGKYIKK